MVSDTGRRTHTPNRVATAGHRGFAWLQRIPPAIARAAILYIILVIVLATQSSQVLTVDNAQVVATQVAVLGIVSLGHMLVLIGGGFDLSISGVIPLGAVTYVQLANTTIGTPAAFTITLLVGGTVGAVNGILVTKLRINPLIATLATLSICEGLAYLVTDGRTVPMEQAGPAFINHSTPFGVPAFVLVFVGLAVVIFAVLRWTVPGRAIYAVGGGREAARLAGMRVNVIQAATFVASSILAAVAGIVLASQLRAGSPNLAADMNLNSITAVVLGGASLTGGVGSVIGTVLGVLILGTLSNGLALMQVSAYYQLVATGCVLIVAVSFAQLRLTGLGRSTAFRRWLPKRSDLRP